MNKGMNYDLICSISSIGSKDSSGGSSLVAVVYLNPGCFLVFYRMEDTMGFEGGVGLCN